MKTIGFIGLGHMGGPMAANLVKAGHAVKGFDLVPALLEDAARGGVAACRSLEEVVAGCDAVITMLPAGSHVATVWTRLMSMAVSGTLLIDCSTIDMESARMAHELARTHGFAALDAPVSGGTAGAAAATLTFMVGGEAQDFARGEPLLRAMGQKIVHCGGACMGQAAKICNNMILGISMIAVSEAFVLAERLGLAHQSLFDVASASSGQCWSLTSYCPVPGPVPASPANRDYRPGFTAALMLKDLMLSQEAAKLCDAATPLGREAARLYQQFNDAGAGARDFSGIVAMIRDLARA